MKFPAFLAAGLPLACAAMAAEKSGHAEASLLCAVSSYQPGKPFPVGVKLRIEDGWHSYWVNPGEGGMPLSAKWTLPEGWSAGELQAPAPKRFMTGELPGFGYEGEAVYLVNLTPPASATGDAEVTVKLSWLTCNDSACIPGDAELTLKLPAGEGAAGPEAGALSAAAAKIPRVLEDADAVVSEKDGRVVVTFAAVEGYDFDGCQVFPATPEVMDAGSPVDVKKSEEGWTASAPKNEYASGAVTACDLVLTGGKLSRPVLVRAQGK